MMSNCKETAGVEHLYCDSKGEVSPPFEPGGAIEYLCGELHSFRYS